MKSDLHPENYRLVAFKDMSNDNIFITKSTAETKETVKVDGVEYPLVKLEISRTSHPYYTGKSKLVDTAGRIDKFKNRYANLTKKEDVKENKELDNAVDPKQEESNQKNTEPDKIDQKSKTENQISIKEEAKATSDNDSNSSETSNIQTEEDQKKDNEVSILEQPKDEATDDSQSDESDVPQKNSESKS